MQGQQYTYLCLAEAEALASIKQVLHRVKLQVKARFDKAGQKILATELYLEWLQALSFVLTAIEVST